MTVISSPPVAPALLALTGTPVVVVQSKRILSDGALAVRLRPNQDPLGDSVHTLYVTPTQTAADIQTWLDARKSDVAAQYAALHAAHAALVSVE